MKIGIVTVLGHFNYGNRLQNYALQEFLSKLDVKVETIWYDKNKWGSPYVYLPELPLMKNYFSKIYLKHMIKFILNWNGYRKQNYLLRKYYGEECVRQYNIKKFSDKYININYKYQIENSRYDSKKINKFSDSLKKEYDYFLVGSDLIWFPNLDFYYIKFLRFVEKDKRITYAPSLGTNKILLKDRDLELLKQGYNEFSNLSVREKIGSQILYKLTNKEFPVLVDPTLLLLKEEWKLISRRPEWYTDEKYIFTYFLGKPSSVIKNIAKKNKWKIYNLMDRDNFNLYTSKVEEFLFLIKNAQLVCTDSFHGAVFSIIFNVPFLVVNRNEKGGVDLTSRIETLLNLFNYQDRYIVNGKCDLSDEEILNMDFSNVKVIQEREIKRSTEYMKKALNLE